MPDSMVVEINHNLRLLGTAHISTKSVEAVKQQIAEFNPDVVAVELCKSRYDSLVSGRRLDKEGLLKVIKEGKAPLVLLQSLLAAEQRKLGLDEGQQPGAELLEAVSIAQSLELQVELIDRDIQTTLRRAWKKMKFREKFKIIFSMLGDDEDDLEVDLDEILENRDILSDLMNELKDFSPGAGEVLIDERDAYLAQKILAIDSDKRTLAVVGAGHLSGIENILSANQPADNLDELATVPKRSALSKSVPWLIPLFVFGLFGYFLYQGSSVDLVELFTVWTLANAVLAAIGCIIARGHILAVLTAALASPITSLNPTLAAGWFAGYVQLKVAEPTAEDLHQFLKLESLGSFWSNKAGRVLLVTALTNLGSMIGAWVAAAGLLGGI
ncbi:MAG TPA: TraB/GumN family protein [Candidatus Poseidoniaceae archaeon]|nr:MAG TPA: TraB/GumN family protein [Candidatus Poseidoniales archaeon]HII36992.1 TraB/GumN family protein [Candidatus Poseidoniaceae archaeon]